MSDPKVPMDALRKFSSGTPMSLGDVESIGAYVRAVDASTAAARDEALADVLRDAWRAECAPLVTGTSLEPHYRKGYLAQARAARAHIEKEQPRSGVALIALREAYVLLADIRHKWCGRNSAAGQMLLANMRDAIAAETPCDPCDVSSGVTSAIVTAYMEQSQ